MTIFFILPVVLLGAALVSLVTQHRGGGFADLDVALRTTLLAFVAWSLAGWFLETRQEEPSEAPQAPPLVVVPSVEDSVAALLAPRAEDEEMLLPVATLIVREARLRRVDPMMIAAIMGVENPWLRSDAVSRAGAVGLMQVMPFHEGGWSCSGPLDDAETSVCLGTAIFGAYLEEALREALWRYNGCRNRRAACGGYPDLVMGNLPR